jgi:hypothetical protein
MGLPHTCMTAPHAPSGVLKAAPVPLPSPSSQQHSRRLDSGSVQRPSGAEARNGPGEPLNAASPGLRLRYPQDGGAGPVPLQNVSGRVPVGQDGREYGSGLEGEDEILEK